MATITSTELGAVGRYINLGSPAEHDNIGAQTIMAYLRPGTIASNTLQYIFCKHPSGLAIRLAIGKTPAGDGYFTAGSSSSGVSLAPNRAAAAASGYVVSGTWRNYCATWDGSLNYTGIKLYADGGEVTYGTTGTFASGTGTIATDSTEDICLLNRLSDFARSLVGDVAYIARWNRVLSAAEVLSAKTLGPLAVPDGLILLWANEQDYSTLALTPTARTTHVDGVIPPNTALGEASDTTAPTLSLATVTVTGTTTATGSVTTDEANGTLYAVVTTSATAPTKAQVKAGQDHTGAAAVWDDSQVVSSASLKEFSVTGLTADTAYYLHFVHEDAAENQSDVASSTAFTTETEAVPTKGVSITLYNGTTPRGAIAGIVALWWDATTPSGAPDFETTTASTTAGGLMVIDIDGATALDFDDEGFLLLYKLDATDHRDSLVFAGRVAVRDIA